MKRIIALLLLLLMLFNLASCNNSSNETEIDGTYIESIDDTLLKADEVDQPSNDTEEINDSDPADTEENSYSANGGTGDCTVHSVVYHGFPYDLIETIGEEKFDNWLENCKKKSEDYNDNGCIYASNIYDFVHDLNIPKEAFVDFYNRSGYYYLRDYDIDLLYDGTAEENDAYYRDYLERENTIMAKRGAFDHVKGYIFTTRMSELIKVLGEDLSSGKVSLAEMVYILDMPREELESIIAQSKELVPYLLRYDYDLDLIYNQREYVEELIEEHSAFYIDLLFCGEEPREEAYPAE
ncbi:MAG: hypothetical protein IJD17_05255 [Clostridia bacterium]|nr:hypothetical protein [Clostridia bacterium]